MGLRIDRGSGQRGPRRRRLPGTAQFQGGASGAGRLPQLTTPTAGLQAIANAAQSAGRLVETLRTEEEARKRVQDETGKMNQQVAGKTRKNEEAQPSPPGKDSQSPEGKPPPAQDAEGAPPPASAPSHSQHQDPTDVLSPYESAELNALRDDGRDAALGAAVEAERALDAGEDPVGVLERFEQRAEKARERLSDLPREQRSALLEEQTIRFVIQQERLLERVNVLQTEAALEKQQRHITVTLDDFEANSRHAPDLEAGAEIATNALAEIDATIAAAERFRGLTDDQRAALQQYRADARRHIPAQIVLDELDRRLAAAAAQREDEAPQEALARFELEGKQLIFGLLDAAPFISEEDRPALEERLTARHADAVTATRQTHKQLMLEQERQIRERVAQAGIRATKGELPRSELLDLKGTISPQDFEHLSATVEQKEQEQRDLHEATRRYQARDLSPENPADRKAYNAVYSSPAGPGERIFTLITEGAIAEAVELQLAEVRNQGMLANPVLLPLARLLTRRPPADTSPSRTASAADAAEEPNTEGNSDDAAEVQL